MATDTNNTTRPATMDEALRDSLLHVTDELTGKPGAAMVQPHAYQAAGTFAVAAAIRDLAAAVREATADRRRAERHARMRGRNQR